MQKQLRKKITTFIIYFPVTLVFLQVAFNLFALIDRPLYNEMGFYLNTFIGTNVFFSLFLLCFTFLFPFCKISRAAAIAECLFAINFLIIKEDNLYNITFQIIVGIIALICTYYFFKNKFPLCRLALWHKFFMFFCITGSCSKAIHLFTIDTEITVNRLHNDTK